ncbi:MAG: nitroreductase family protein [Velocimicrobium sp.]
MPNSINGQQSSVIVIKDKETNLAATKNGFQQIIHESIEGTMVGTFDSGLAMGASIIAAESLGIGIVPIGGIRKNPTEMIELLHLPEYTYPVAGLALGYPSDNSRQKPRLPFETYKHIETYKTEGLLKAINEYDKTMEDYLGEVGREKEVNWSNYTSNIYQSIYFPKVYPTLKNQKFLNKNESKKGQIIILTLFAFIHYYCFISLTWRNHKIILLTYALRFYTRH